MGQGFHGALAIHFAETIVPRCSISSPIWYPMVETAVSIIEEEEQEQRASAWWRNHRMTLEQQNFTPGLIQQLQQASAEIALRIWIVDNSGSMNQYDRHRFVQSNNTKVEYDQGVNCNRWNEIVETVSYHADLAIIAKAPIVFRLVNAFSDIPLEYSIDSSDDSSSSYDDYNVQQDLHQLEHSFQTVKPSGRRKMLTQCIDEIRPRIVSMKKKLQANSQLVAVIIATDGLPTNESGRTGSDEAELFIDALQTLENLPVVLTIRLSTDDKQVINVSQLDIFVIHGRYFVHRHFHCAL